jgi:DNA-binding winged helix-turn-helix (wHTH) protein/TolB-like protein
VDPGTPDVFRFADVRVDTRAHQVLRAGVPVALEPKAYAVLVELLRRPGEAIARDDLLDAVWGHRHVTPGVLNRVIAMLRRELGDDADHPRLIRTVHGTGYAFIGTLLPDEPEAPAVPVATRPPPRRRHWLLAAGIVAALATWLFLPVAREPQPRPAATAPTPADPAPIEAPLLAVLPIESVDADRELAMQLRDSLEESLRRVDGLRVIARESTQAVATDEVDRASIARALGATHVLSGAVLSKPDDAVAIDLQLYDVRSRGVSLARRFEQPRAQALRFLGPALDALQTGLLGSTTQRRADPVLGAALNAQDLYWLARRYQGDNSVAGASRSLALLDQALELDPSFALAWSAVASGHRMLANGGAEPIEVAVAKMDEAVGRALALDPDLAAAWLEKTMARTVQWHTLEAEAPARRAVELAPDDPDVLAISGNVALYLGRPREALALHRRSNKMNPRSNYVPGLIGFDLMTLGDFDAAMAEAESQWPDPVQFPSSDMLRRGRLTYGRIGLAAGPPETRAPYGILALAQALSMLGEHERAEAEIARIDTAPPRPPMYLAVRLELFWRRGAADEAVAWLRGEGRDIAQQPWLDAGLAQALAVAGDDAGALRTYDAALADPVMRARLSYSWFPTRIGTFQVANWIALRRAAGKSYAAELAGLKELMAQFRANGVQLPALDYQYAVVALLEDDHAAAGAALTRAIDRGWLDAVALDTDIAWRSVKDASWLVAARARIQRRLAEEGAIAKAAGG